MRFLAWCAVLLVAFAGCKRGVADHAAASPAQSPAGAATPRATAVAAASLPPGIDACSLISNDEVGAVQEATITDAKPSKGMSAEMLVTQCYYASKEPNRSVSLALLQIGGSPGLSPRDYWEKTFGKFRDGKEEEREKAQDKSEKHREDEEAIPPKKVEGLGEEAFWSGNKFGGALYVLKANAIVRVSVGGPFDEKTKIEKSKALAEKALQKF